MKRQVRKSCRRLEVPVVSAPVLLCVLSVVLLGSCYPSPLNQNYELVVVTANPELGSVFLSTGTGEISNLELPPVYARAWFSPVPLTLTTTENGTPRSRFQGFLVTGSSGPGYWAPRGSIVVLPAEDVNEVHANFGFESNRSPVWIDADRALFVSDRDGGESVYQLDLRNGRGVTRITEPAPGTADHRGERWEILKCWKNRPLVYLRRSITSWSDSAQVSTVDYRGFVLDMDTGTLLEAAFDSYEWVPYQLPSAVSPSGNSLVIERLTGFDDGADHLALHVRTASGGTVADIPRTAYRLEVRGRPSGNAVFTDEYRLTRESVVTFDKRSVLDLSTGELKDISFKINVFPFGPICDRYSIQVSPDGTRLLTAMEVVNGTAPLGANISIIDSRGNRSEIGGVKDTLVPLRYEGLHWSADGTLIIGRHTGTGVWAAWSAVDGGGAALYSAENDPGVPAERSDFLFPFPDGIVPDLPAATAEEPGGTRSLVTRYNGGPLDIYLSDGSSFTRLTGPGAEGGLE